MSLSSSSLSPFRNLPPDCIHFIFHYHEFDLSPYTESHRFAEHRSSNGIDSGIRPRVFLSHIGRRDPDWIFLTQYAHCCHLFGDNALEFIDKCRDTNSKPSFYQLSMSTSLYFWERDKPVTGFRGIQKLDLCGYDFSSLPSDCCENFRGIQCLSVIQCTFPPNNCLLKNLRGIKELEIEDCGGISLTGEDFHNLRGIHELTIRNTGFDLSSQHLKQLGGIKTLRIRSKAPLLSTTINDDSMKHLRGVVSLHIQGKLFHGITDAGISHLRGVRELSLCDLPLVTSSMFQHLRGVRELTLSGLPLVTSAMFHHLRGVKELSIYKMPEVTSSIFQHLRGIESLEIDDCWSITFESQHLRHLSGIKKLVVKTVNDLDANAWKSNLVLDDDRLQHLHSVEEMTLDGVYSVPNANAFRHLSQVRDMSLCGDGVVEMDTSAFSHLKQVENLHFKEFAFHENSVHESYLDDMPKLEHMEVEECVVVQNHSYRVSSLSEAIISDMEPISFSLSRRSSSPFSDWIRRQCFRL